MLSQTYNTKNLISKVLENYDFPDITNKEAERFTKTLVKELSMIINLGGRVKINGLGLFVVCVRKGRSCVDPNNKESKIYVPDTRVVRFKPSYTIKQSVKARK